MVYGATVSKDTITEITDKALEGLLEWRDRPLDKVYPMMVIDAIMVKVRDEQVTNRPGAWIYTSSSCVSVKRMREPRRWGFRVSRSEYFQLSAITTGAPPSPELPTKVWINQTPSKIESEDK